MAVRGVDTSRSTPASARERALAPTSPLMPTAAAMRSRPLSSTAGLRIAPVRVSTGQGAVGFGEHGHVDGRVFEQVEHLARVGAHRAR